MFTYCDQLSDDLASTNVCASSTSIRHSFLKMFPRGMRKILNSLQIAKMIHPRKLIELLTSVRAHLLWCFKQRFNYIDFYGFSDGLGAEAPHPFSWDS